MAFTSYGAVRPWAKAIKEEVLERRMPPWGALDGFGEFFDDISLTSEEIHVLADWVEGGAPEGDSQYLPTGLNRPAPLPAAGRPAGASMVFEDGWQIRQPLTLLAIRAESPLRATVEVPGGRTIPLIWVREVRPQHPQAYRFRAPVRLPVGARVRVSGGQSVRVWIK